METGQDTGGLQHVRTRGPGWRDHAEREGSSHRCCGVSWGPLWAGGPSRVLGRTGHVCRPWQGRDADRNPGGCWQLSKHRASLIIPPPTLCFCRWPPPAPACPRRPPRAPLTRSGGNRSRSQVSALSLCVLLGLAPARQQAQSAGADPGPRGSRASHLPAHVGANAATARPPHPRLDKHAGGQVGSGFRALPPLAPVPESWARLFPARLCFHCSLSLDTLPASTQPRASALAQLLPTPCARTGAAQVLWGGRAEGALL